MRWCRVGIQPVDKWLQFRLQFGSAKEAAVCVCVRARDCACVCVSLTLCQFESETDRKKKCLRACV